MPTSDKTSKKVVNSKNIFARIKTFISSKANLRKFFMIKLIIILVLFTIFYILKIAKHYPREIILETKADHFGVTFSTKYSAEIGLDYQEVYGAMLSELKVKNIRIQFIGTRWKKKRVCLILVFMII